MNPFDRIVKESFQSVFLHSSQRLLGLDLRHALVTKMDPTINRPTHREVDFLRHVKMPDGEKFLLHIEFQTEDHKHMHLRMAEYRAMLQSNYDLPVRQYLIYLGQAPSKMQSRLPEAYQIIEYTMIALRELKPEHFLHSESPDEIIYAILSNYSRDQAKQVVAKVLERLHALQLNAQDLKKYIQYLLTLGQLRKLDKQVIKEVQAMPITIDITQNALFKQAFAEGVEKTKKQSIIGLLKLDKFSIEDIAKGLDVSEEYVLEIKQSLDKE